MNLWIFQEKSYKKTIRRLIDESPTPRGMVSKIADAIGCQRSYLSQVLNGKVHLNRDQLWAVGRFFALEPLENRFIELLFDCERATTPAFRKHLELELADLRRQVEELAPRFSQSVRFEAEAAGFYYATWMPAAIHLLTSVPQAGTHGTIARRLGLPENMVESYLKMLSEMGLVSSQHGQWRFAGGASFVARESPFVAQHHQNWRNLACDHARALSNDGIHYTMVQTMSRHDFERIKAMILELIDREKAIADPSPPESLTALNIDFFQPRSEYS